MKSKEILPENKRITVSEEEGYFEINGETQTDFNIDRELSNDEYDRISKCLELLQIYHKALEAAESEIEELQNANQDWKEKFAYHDDMLKKKYKEESLANYEKANKILDTTYCEWGSGESGYTVESVEKALKIAAGVE